MAHRELHRTLGSALHLQSSTRRRIGLKPRSFRLDRNAHSLRNLHDGQDVSLTQSARLHAIVRYFAGQRFHMFHRTPGSPIFTDSIPRDSIKWRMRIFSPIYGIVNGRILQTVTQRFVVRQNFPTRRNQRSRSQIPVVNPIILLHASSSHHSMNCNRNLRSTKTMRLANTKRFLVLNRNHTQPLRRCAAAQTWICLSTRKAVQYPRVKAGRAQRPTDVPRPFCAPCSARTIGPRA